MPSTPKRSSLECCGSKTGQHYADCRNHPSQQPVTEPPVWPTGFPINPDDGRLGPPEHVHLPKPPEVTDIFGKQISFEPVEKVTARVLGDWWRERAEAEIGMVAAKAVEYGSADLVEIGRQLHQAGVRLPNDMQPYDHDRDAYLAELGIYFYVCGKLARWTSAVTEGRPVSTDTLLDIGVYVRMAQRVRETGRWP